MMVVVYMFLVGGLAGCAQNDVISFQLHLLHNYLTYLILL